MNFPLPPTDNLYKFCAIVGVVLLVFGIVYPQQELFQVQGKIVDIETSVHVMQKQTEYLKLDLHAAQQVTNTASPSARDMQARSRKLQITTIELGGKVQHIVALNRQAKGYIIGAVVCSFVGFFLALFGFVRWYKVVQVPADEILAAQMPRKDT